MVVSQLVKMAVVCQSAGSSALIFSKKIESPNMLC